MEQYQRLIIKAAWAVASTLMVLVLWGIVVVLAVYAVVHLFLEAFF